GSSGRVSVRPLRPHFCPYELSSHSLRSVRLSSMLVPYIRRSHKRFARWLSHSSHSLHIRRAGRLTLYLSGLHRLHSSFRLSGIFFGSSYAWSFFIFLCFCKG